jgi:hypothetical protein
MKLDIIALIQTHEYVNQIALIVVMLEERSDEASGVVGNSILF